MIDGMKERFAIIRKEQGLNVKQFAEALGMEATTVSSIETGKREPSKEVLLRLATYYAVSLNWIFTGVGEKLLTKAIYPEIILSGKEQKSFFIPVLDQSYSAGKGSELNDDLIKAVIPAPPYLSQYGEKLAAVFVQGDSMEPTLKNGDMIVCDSCGWSGEGIYAIQMDGCGLVKRLSRRPGKIVIQSDNPKYESFEEPAESEAVRIVGRVRCIVKNSD